ncbi:MAG: DUF4124 domain-containing protein [Desulfamplus sp.]|nr:DUF4124 domain-containing protein [Desulfamplus sp.]
MKLLQFVIYIIWLITIGVSPVYSEFYQYIDENGVLSFTDDISKLSSEQRKQIKKIKEIKTKPVIDINNIPQAQQQTQTDSSTSEEKEAGEEKRSKELTKEAEELKQIDYKLKEEYASLKDDKDRLDVLHERLKNDKGVSEAVLEDFRKQVSEINIRTQQYNADLQAYKKRVNDYNDKVNK